ncbi:MAG: hypothetical protein H7X93_06635 [Sphingomonadaceae bacterium]|nr:hypothetical protein [Sphingomonadaceae bacterium]
MRMLLFTSLVSATLASAAPAQTPTRTLTHDGVTYTYTVDEQDGRTIIVGRSSIGGRYRLSVQDGYVRGTVNASRVRFPVSDAADVEIATIAD